MAVCFLKNKKGISPLIATFMLLFFAIVLGVIVMNWGRAQLEEGARCPVDTGIHIVSVNNAPEICYGGRGEDGFINFILENGVKQDISKVHIRILGTKNLLEMDIADSYIKKGESLMGNVPYSFDLFGDIRQVKITPKIILYGNEELICQEQSIEITRLKVC